MFPTQTATSRTFTAIKFSRVSLAKGYHLFEWNSSSYLLVVDYYSHYIELAKLSSTTSTAVIPHLKSIFPRHGFPQVVVNASSKSGTLDTFLIFEKIVFKV